MGCYTLEALLEIVSSRGSEMLGWRDRLSVGRGSAFKPKQGKRASLDRVLQE